MPCPQHGDIPAALERFDADVVVRLPEALPYGGIYHGHDGFHEYMGKLRACWERFEITVDDTFEAGSSIVVRESLKGVAKAGGQAVEMPLLLAFAAQGGKITRQEVFYWDMAAVAAA